MSTSGVWKYFKKADAGDKVQCLIDKCGTKLSYSGGSTSVMWTHQNLKEMIEVLSVFQKAALQFCEENSTCSMILHALTFLRKFLERKNVE
jgi:hypothetical protein